MDDLTRKNIVFYHNQIRDVQTISKPQPSGLTLLEYDRDLEELSTCWARRCSNEYSDCFLTPKFNETSQSVVQLILEDGESPSHFLWRQMMSYWLKQSNSISHVAFRELPSGREYEFIHNFAQVMSDNIRFLGCAWSVMNNLLTFACSYGPRGPDPGEGIYRIGKFCSRCPKNFECDGKRPFSRLCKRKRELEMTTTGYPHTTKITEKMKSMPPNWKITKRISSHSSTTFALTTESQKAFKVFPSTTHQATTHGRSTASSIISASRRNQMTTNRETTQAVHVISSMETFQNTTRTGTTPSSNISFASFESAKEYIDSSPRTTTRNGTILLPIISVPALESQKSFLGSSSSTFLPTSMKATIQSSTKSDLTFNSQKSYMVSSSTTSITTNKEGTTELPTLLVAIFDSSVPHMNSSWSLNMKLNEKLEHSTEALSKFVHSAENVQFLGVNLSSTNEYKNSSDSLAPSSGMPSTGATGKDELQTDGSDGKNWSLNSPLTEDLSEPISKNGEEHLLLEGENLVKTEYLERTSMCSVQPECSKEETARIPEDFTRATRIHEVQPGWIDEDKTNPTVFSIQEPRPFFPEWNYRIKTNYEPTLSTDRLFPQLFPNMKSAKHKDSQRFNRSFIRQNRPLPKPPINSDTGAPDFYHYPAEISDRTSIKVIKNNMAPNQKSKQRTAMLPLSETASYDFYRPRPTNPPFAPAIPPLPADVLLGQEKSQTSDSTLDMSECEEVTCDYFSSGAPSFSEIPEVISITPLPLDYPGVAIDGFEETYHFLETTIDPWQDSALDTGWPNSRESPELRTPFPDHPHQTEYETTTAASLSKMSNATDFGNITLGFPQMRSGGDRKSKSRSTLPLLIFLLIGFVFIIVGIALFMLLMYTLRLSVI